MFDENGDYKRDINPRIRIDVYDGSTLLWINGKPMVNGVRKVEFYATGSGEKQEVKLNLEIDPTRQVKRAEEREQKPLKPTWSKEQSEAAEAERMKAEEAVD